MPNIPAEKLRSPEQSRLFTEVSPDRLTVYPPGITTSSPAVGSVSLSQFCAVFQSLSVSPSQVTVSAWPLLAPNPRSTRGMITPVRIPRRARLAPIPARACLSGRAPAPAGAGPDSPRTLAATHSDRCVFIDSLLLPRLANQALHSVAGTTADVAPGRNICKSHEETAKKLSRPYESGTGVSFGCSGRTGTRRVRASSGQRRRCASALDR